MKETLAPKAVSIQPTDDHACPSCSSRKLSVFYQVANVPVHSCLMMPTAEAAIAFPKGDVVLAVCQDCGFITNIAFDPKWSAYAPNYEDQQSFSPTFNQFALDLAEHLVAKYDLHNKDIIEIGCSKGDFLLLLCQLGQNRGVGIDPSAVPGRVQSEAADRVTFISEYYSEAHSQYVGDFICCRHTLEHIQPTAEFLRTVRRSIGDRLHTGVFFELPDTTRVLRDQAFEDIYYEHCSYFTLGSLARLFRSCGFEVTDLHRAYGDQYLLIEAQPTDTRSNRTYAEEESVAETLQDVATFVNKIEAKIRYWQQHLNQMQQQGKRIVVWGSGSKCVAFLTTLHTIDKIQHVVDINPHRWGKFIPGVGKQIQPPEFLRNYKPDQVIVMNSIYCPEIQHLLNQMGVATEVTPI